MKRAKISFLSFISLVLLSFGGVDVSAQDASIGASLTAKLGMYVFPANDQTPDQVNKDENDCYAWAVQQSGVDPLNPPEVQAEQVATGPDGAMIRGGARGAAGGAAIGAIAGDAGKGAAIGAVVGGVRGRRAKSAGDAAAQQQADATAQQTEANLMNSFKKAFSVCLEGKGYTVK